MVLVAMLSKTKAPAISSLSTKNIFLDLGKVEKFVVAVGGLDLYSAVH